MTKRILLSWIGFSDLSTKVEDPGPVIRFLDGCEEPFDCIFLLNDVVPPAAPPPGKKEILSPENFTELLFNRFQLAPYQIRRIDAQQSLHNSLPEIWEFTMRQADWLADEHRGGLFSLLLSPGYPSAQSAMMLASQTSKLRNEQVRLFSTSREKNVETVELPFRISLEGIIRRGQSEPAESEAVALIAGSGGAIQAVKEQILSVARFAPHFSTLILGERGVGKELVARALHAASPRRQGPFVAVNCAQIVGTLAEGELFGQTKGAGTGLENRQGFVRTAEGGTIFLDEIGLLPLETQGKLLRFLQEGKIRVVGEEKERTQNVWVIAATNRDLAKAVKKGDFLPDLLDRLEAWTIQVPPLRERAEDIPAVAKKLLNQLNETFRGVTGYAPKSFAEDAIKQLQQHDWPGNVRELQNVLRRLVITSGTQITAGDVDRMLGAVNPAAEFHRPLTHLRDENLLHLAAAVLDELLDRFHSLEKPFLPAPRETFYNFPAEVVFPLLTGRAFHRSGKNKTEAALFLGLEKTDKKPEGRPLDLRTHYIPTLPIYQRWKDAGMLKEEIIQQLRFGPAEIQE